MKYETALNYYYRTKNKEKYKHLKERIANIKDNPTKNVINNMLLSSLIYDKANGTNSYEILERYLRGYNYEY